MTVHRWSIVAPAWYVADQLPARLERMYGPSWAMKKVALDHLYFVDAGNDRLPMSRGYHLQQMTGAVLVEECRQAQNLNAGVCISLCVDMLYAEAELTA